MADYDSSPLMKSALEVLCHSVEHFVTATPKDDRLAVLHLAQTVELAAKAILVEHNTSIYDARNENKTLTWRQCMERLGQLWGLDPAPQFARLELLIDERNAMQHRFGTVDRLTIDYHMGTVFLFFEDLMNREYGADLHGFLRETLPLDVWTRCRYVKDENQTRIDRALALVSQGDATSGLLEAFAALDGDVLLRATRLLGQVPSSTLDVLMKYGARLADAGLMPRKDVPKLAELYRLRNAAVHANEQPPIASVQRAIGSAQVFLRHLADSSTEETFSAALTDSLSEVSDRAPDMISAEPSASELLRLVARRQLDSPPPRFVGFSMVARATNAYDRLQQLVDQELLIVYHVPNPVDPAWPTAALRVNHHKPEAEAVLDADVLDRIRSIAYP
jgi:uncharacterized protein YutE (UPF0331/DUF86 family)